MEKYADALIGLSGGAVIGNDGVLWCATPGFALSLKESSKFPKVFQKKSDVLYTGLTFRGESFAVSSVSGNIAKVRNNSSGFVIGKCHNCFIIGFYDNCNASAQCEKAVEKAVEMYLQYFSETRDKLDV